jgi:uncharacterized protein
VSQRKREAARRAAADPAARADQGGSVGEVMVRCAHCGVYLPSSESVRDGEIAYCGSEHRRLGPSAERRE